MTMTLEAFVATLPADEQREIAAEADRLREELHSLSDVRRAMAFTQAQLADAMGIKQASVAQMEQRADLLLSTLRRYVEAMGGEMKIVLRFPDRPPIELERLADVSAHD
jgi:DNA-binding XRE family transcriptional regulator